MREALFDLLKHKIPFTVEDIVFILEWSANQRNNFFRGLPHMIKVCNDFLKEKPLSDDLCMSIEKLIFATGHEYQDEATRRPKLLRLKELILDTNIQLPLVRDDIWASAALEDIQALPTEKQTAWALLLHQCQLINSSSPSAKWMKDTDGYLDTIGRADFFQHYCVGSRWWVAATETAEPFR